MEMKRLSPTKLLLPADDGEVRRFLTFADRSVQYQIQKLKKNLRWKMNNPDTYFEHLERLKDSSTKTILFYDEENRPYTYSGLWQDLSMRFRWTLSESNLTYPDETCNLPWQQVPPTMRYYQQEAVDALINAKHGAVELPTASGKSLILLNISKRLSYPTIIMTPSAAITDQLFHQYVAAFGSKYVGKFGSGKKQYNKLFTIATAQALTRLTPGDPAYECLSNAQVFISDECFPYDQKIITSKGARRIGTIYNIFHQGRPVDVLSYNEQRQCFEFKRVLNAWKRSSDKASLVRITAGGRRLTCTDNHPLLTTKGWRRAGDIMIGERLIGNRCRKQLRNSNVIQWNTDQEQLILGSYLGDGSITRHKQVYRLRIIHGMAQREYLIWLNNLLGENTIEHIRSNGYSGKPAVRFSTKLFHSDINFSSPKQSGVDAVLDRIDDRGLAIWYLDDGYYTRYFTKGAVECGFIRLHTESFSLENQHKILQKFHQLGYTSARLGQDSGKDWCYYYILLPKGDSQRFLQRIAPYCPVSMAYKFPAVLHGALGSYAWCSEISSVGISTVSDVCGISRDELIPARHRSSNRCRHLLQLYDLEVADNHNFMVGYNTGIVAHNCHTTPAATFEHVCTGLAAKAPYRFFLSATQLRTDGSDMVLKGITGPIVYRKTYRELVDESYVARMHFKVFTAPPSINANCDDPNKETRRQLYYNPAVVKLAADLANKSVTLLNRPTVIMIEEFKQFLQLKNYLTVPYEFVHGGASGTVKDILPPEYWKCDTKRIVDDFNAGNVKLLIGTSAIGTGVDLRPVQCLIYLQGDASEIKVRQAIGRGSRLAPGKQDCWVCDFKIAGSRTMERHYLARKRIYQSMGEVEEYV